MTNMKPPAPVSVTTIPSITPSQLAHVGGGTDALAEEILKVYRQDPNSIYSNRRVDG
jgi:hypothetical protein